MKLALLMTMLAVNRLFAKSVVIFEGTLPCSHPFMATVTLEEVDPARNDRVKIQEFNGIKTGKTSMNYKATDKFLFWDPDHVEPRLKIRHSCKKNNPTPIEFTYICQHYPGTRDNLHVAKNIDLLNPPNEFGAC